MNILVVGNGFDLAHGLPTKYSDFLNFVDVLFKCQSKMFPLLQNDDFKEIDKNIKNLLNEKLRDLFNISEYEYIYYINSWKDLVFDNFWIEYFRENKDIIEENWIDFEKEISIVIRKFDDILKSGKLNRGYVQLSEFNHFENSLASRNITGVFKTLYPTSTSVKYGVIKKRLEDDLEKLTIALGKYLIEFVDCIDNDLYSVDILLANIDKVISFNYTNTFLKKYNNSSDVSIDFIHGEVSRLKNNIVLGIDEYLSSKECDNDVEFIKFKKYYQIIDKQITHEYKKWFDEDSEQSEKNENPSNHNLYVFGHSLDITDKEILSELILRDDIKTTIFYHNDETRGKLIANLQIIIGQKELIKRTNYPHKTIEFKKQTPLINKQEFDKKREFVKNVDAILSKLSG